MVLTQQSHHVFRIRDFSEPGETTQIAKESCNLSAMTFELLLSARGNDQISYLWRKETSQPTHAFDLTHLISNTLFEVLVQLLHLFCSLAQLLQKSCSMAITA